MVTPKTLEGFGDPRPRILKSEMIIFKIMVTPY